MCNHSYGLLAIYNPKVLSDSLSIAVDDGARPITVKGADFHRLEPGQCLNDTIIEASLQYEHPSLYTNPYQVRITQDNSPTLITTQHADNESCIPRKFFSLLRAQRESTVSPWDTDRLKQIHR